MPSLGCTLTVMKIVSPSTHNTRGSRRDCEAGIRGGSTNTMSLSYNFAESVMNRIVKTFASKVFYLRSGE